MPKKREKKVEEGAPEWMMTFGDLMSQLLTFFILLISFSIFDEVKYNSMKGSLQYSFGVFPGWEQPLMDTVRRPPERPGEEEKLGGVGYRIKEYMYKQEMKGSIRVSLREEGLAIVLRSAGKPVMFRSGEAEITEEFYGILDKIASELVKIPNKVRIEGHTDNIPINTPKYPSNWELSSARAVSVLRYLVRKGVDPARLSAGGYGEFRPVDTNETEEGRQKNRRVEIIILKEKGRSQ